MHTKLKNVLQMTKTGILNDPKCLFSFKDRKCLLLELGPLLADENGRHAVVGPGLVRRARLSIAVVERILPVWEECFTLRDPHAMLGLADKYLRAEISREELLEDAYEFRGELDNTVFIQNDRALLAGRASVCAPYVAAMDELLEPDDGCSLQELYDPQDPDLWDCAFWAAGAFAGGMPWTSKFDKQQYCEFWMWYLDVAVPNAWNAVSESLI